MVYLYSGAVKMKLAMFTKHITEYTYIRTLSNRSFVLLVRCAIFRKFPRTLFTRSNAEYGHIYVYYLYILYELY